jgi:hypothetical protein
MLPNGLQAWEVADASELRSIGKIGVFSVTIYNFAVPQFRFLAYSFKGR